jgi:hypothetical protein
MSWLKFMRMWILISVLILPLVSYAAPQTWIIGNDEIKREMSFSEASGLVTEQLSDLRTHTDFILPSKPHDKRSQEFSFQCNGHTFGGSRAELARLGVEVAKATFLSPSVISSL